MPSSYIPSPETAARRPGVDGGSLLGMWGHGDGPTLRHLLGEAETAELVQAGAGHGNALLLRLGADGLYTLLLYYPASGADASGSRLFIERGEFGAMGMVLIVNPEDNREIVRIEGGVTTTEVAGVQMPRSYALYTAVFEGGAGDDGGEAPTNSGIVLEGPLCPPFASFGDGYCVDLGEGRSRFRMELQRVDETVPGAGSESPEAAPPV